MRKAPRGEIYTDLALPLDRAQDEHCGTCEKCIDACPTRAIVGPYRLDARREHRSALVCEHVAWALAQHA